MGTELFFASFVSGSNSLHLYHWSSAIERSELSVSKSIRKLNMSILQSKRRRKRHLILLEINSDLCLGYSRTCYGTYFRYVLVVPLRTRFRVSGCRSLVHGSCQNNNNNSLSLVIVNSTTSVAARLALTSLSHIQSCFDASWSPLTDAKGGVSCLSHGCWISDDGVGVRPYMMRVSNHVPLRILYFVSGGQQHKATSNRW